METLIPGPSSPLSPARARRHEVGISALPDISAQVEAGDSVRLHSFRDGDFLDLHVLEKSADGTCRFMMTQIVGESGTHPEGEGKFDARGVTFSAPFPRDVFGKAMDSYRATAFTWTSKASDGRVRYQAGPACDLLRQSPTWMEDSGLTLHGFAPGNWLDLKFTGINPGRGLMDFEIQQVAGGVAGARQRACGEFRDGALVFAEPYATDAFGKPLTSYRASSFERFGPSERPVGTEEVVAKVEAALAAPRSAEARPDPTLAALVERSLATEASLRGLSSEVRELTQAVRALVGREVPAAAQARLPVPEDAAPAVLPQESASVSVLANELTMERTSVTMPGQAAETAREAAPDRATDVAREIATVSARAGGKISWGAKEVVLFRLGETAYSVRPTKVGAETYTPKDGGPWNAENTGARLWKMWLADGGDAFSEPAWKAAMALLSAGVAAANAKAENRVGKDVELAHELDAAIGREGKAVRAGRTVKAGGAGSYLVHVEAGEREVRADFFERLVAAVAKNRSATRSGVRIRGAAGAWEYLPKGAKTWKQATDAAVWALFSEELLWEKWERLEFARYVLRARKGHKGIKLGEVAIQVPETEPDSRVVEIVPAQAGSTVVHEKVVVRQVDASASAEGQGANRTVQEALETAKTAAMPLLPAQPSPAKLTKR